MRMPVAWAILGELTKESVRATAAALVLDGLTDNQIRAIFNYALEIERSIEESE